VVAFLNGERISINRARNLDVDAAVADSQFSSDINPSAPNSGNTATTETTLPPKYNAPGVQKVENVNSVKGVFFTVQIGVYSKPVPEGTFSYQRLLVRPLSSGLTRYNAGVYQTALAAEQAKNTIVNSITDAFVTAYYKGKRISLDEAARLLNQN
jgi:hypothetical protein